MTDVPEVTDPEATDVAPTAELGAPEEEPAAPAAAVAAAPATVPAAPTEWPEDEFQREAERYLVRAILRGSAFGIPIFVAVYLGLVAIAVGGLGYPLGPTLVMGAAVGLLAGVFFGAWAGFVQSVEKLEEAQRRAHRGD